MLYGYFLFEYGDLLKLRKAHLYMFKEPEGYQWWLPQGGAEYQYSDGTSTQTNPLLSIALPFLRPFGP